MKLLEIEDKRLKSTHFWKKDDLCYSFHSKNWFSLNFNQLPLFGWFASSELIIDQLVMATNSLKGRKILLKDKFLVIETHYALNSNDITHVAFILTDFLPVELLQSTEIIVWRTDLD